MNEIPMARINAQIPLELDERLHQIIPWGMKSLLLRALLEMTVEAVEKHGAVALSSILDKRFNPLTKEILPPQIEGAKT